MKKKIRVIIQILITAAVLIALAVYAGFVTRPMSVENKLGTIKAFHSLQKNSVDVVILGNSHAWKSVDTRIINEEYGISAYNYGIDWMHMETAYLFLKDILKTQKPKLLVLEVHKDEDEMNRNDLDAELFYSRETDASVSDKITFLNNHIGFGADTFENWLSYLFPVVEFHDNWAEISKKSLLPNATVSEYIQSYGYNSSDECEEIEIKTDTYEKEFDEKSLEILGRIFKLCETNNIEVLLFTAPYQTRSVFGESIQRVADSNGYNYVNYLSLLDELEFDPKTDFRNAGHLNDFGAQKLTYHLAEYIKNEYSDILTND